MGLILFAQLIYRSFFFFFHYFPPISLQGVRPFPCPHCDKIFRTSGHRKTHIASHFKSLQQKKHKFARKTNKAKVSKNNLPLPDIPLQEPILITDYGKNAFRSWFFSSFSMNVSQIKAMLLRPHPVPEPSPCFPAVPGGQ